MKTISFLGLVTIIFLIGCGLPDPYENNDREKQNLKGYVNNVRTTTKSPSGETKGSVVSISFNRKGNISNRNSYTYGKLTGSKDFPKYNKHGHLLRTVTYTNAAMFGVESKYENTYDDRGNLIEQSRFSATRGPNVKNNRNLEHEFREKWKYGYDEYGNMVEELNYGPDSLMIKTTFKYDSKSNLIERNNWNQYDSFKSIARTYTYEYDADGNRIAEHYLSRNGEVERTYTYRYDEHGNLLERKNYNRWGESSFGESYEYKYDLQNNWIERANFNKDGEVTSTTVRAISYHGT